jgi:hypothetical protein
MIIVSLTPISFTRGKRNFMWHQIQILFFELQNQYCGPTWLGTKDSWFGHVLSTQIMTDSSKCRCWDSILGRPRGKKETNWTLGWKTEKETGVWKKLGTIAFMWVLDCSWLVTAEALKFELPLMKGLLILSLWKNSMHVVHIITFLFSR